jgi:hypothetical protein
MAPHVPTPGVIVATDSCAHNVVIQIACLGDLDCMVHTPQSEGIILLDETSSAVVYAGTS